MNDDASTAKAILGEELARFEVAFNELGIGFSVSHARREWWRGTARKPPYLSCRYDAGEMSNVNVVAFYYSLLDDWDLLHEDSEAYRRRIRSALREELIHAVQIVKIKEKYDTGEMGTSPSNSSVNWFKSGLENSLAKKPKAKHGIGIAYSMSKTPERAEPS